MTAQPLIHSFVKSLDELLSKGWGDHFDIDRDAAKKKEKLVIRWKKTQHPIPVAFDLSELALQKRDYSWREVHQKVKECLPENMLKQKVSEANRLLRDANRRTLKIVEKDFAEWHRTTGRLLRLMFGREQTEKFLAPCVLPSHIRAGTIQALTFCFEAKIDELKEF